MPALKLLILGGASERQNLFRAKFRRTQKLRRDMSSGFVTESEIEAAKKARQEEWERVRKPDDPENAPEPEPQDNRSLFARLEEQRVAKQDEWDEAHKLKNQVGHRLLFLASGLAQQLLSLSS